MKVFDITNAEELANAAWMALCECPWEESIKPRTETRGLYLGTFQDVDPCGHCVPGEPFKRFACRDFWSALEKKLATYNLELTEGVSEPNDRFVTEYRKMFGRYSQIHYAWGNDGAA